MLRGGRKGFGRSLVRGGGQIATSVVATLIATGLFTLLPPSDHPAALGPELTSGGKYGARIDGAALETVVQPQPQQPRLPIVDWAITPAMATPMVADVAWREPDQGWGITSSRPSHLVEDVGWRADATVPDRTRIQGRVPHRPRIRPAVVAAMAPAPAAPDKFAAPEVVAPAEPSGGLLASATGAVLSVASGTRHVVEEASGGASRLGTAAVGRLAALVR